MVSFVCRLKGSSVAGILRFPFLSPSSYGRRAAMSSASGSIYPADESPSRMSPWLMLPPKAGDNMVCKFYNLAEDRVESFGVELPDSNDAVLVGSSHGWLAFFNRRNNHVFLSNPLSGGLLTLPPIHNLPDPHINLRNGRGTVSKLILSSSPDDDCRAMISFGPGDRLAFCSPGRSGAQWTPIGDLFFEKYDNDEDPPTLFYGRAYEDFVYCSSRKRFSCITEFRIDLENQEPFFPTEFEDWDLHVDPPRSRICSWLSSIRIHGGEECWSWMKENKKLLQSCAQIPYLVYDEQQNNQLFIVTRFVVNAAAADSYKTVGFSALRVGFIGDGVAVDKLRLVDSLDGLAVFVGMNHSFAVSSPAEFGLKPNSIYFTDARFTSPEYHGQDSGIFDYGNKTVSSCPGPYYDYSSQNLSTPVWFTPSQ